MTRPRIQVKLHKSLRNWRLSVAFESSSHCLAIWGPSGSGKSVTLRMIAGLMKPDSGTVRVGQRVLFDSQTGTSLPPQRRRIGMMFQSYALFPHLTVAGNLSFALPQGTSSRAEVLEMAERLEITRLLDRRPGELSGGQCQRVALGRALLAKPDLLLLDEPFNSLDLELRHRMRAELAGLLERIEVPVIVVSHDVEDVRALAREVVIFGDGACSPAVPIPEELLMRPERPVNPLSNFLRSQVPASTRQATETGRHQSAPEMEA